MERPLLLENLPQVTFDDAAIYFSEEQWRNLEDFQKKIYKELIKEIYETMLALGYRIPKPEIVSRIERGEEPCIDSSKKPKLEGAQAEGSKDAALAIKAERESPEASVHAPPGEISSSQERGGAQCPRCGTCCNNQCGAGYQWNPQGMYAGPPMENTPRKTYVAPSPTYFNGGPVSPGYANRADGMPHPTSPMGYANMGMVPLSPHYPVYRNAGDPHTTFPFPERPPNPMFGNFEVNQPAPMGPPGSHLAASEHESRNRNLHAREGPFQERRNPMGPCPGCGTFCNNQCAASFQWEQRRLHHGVPGAMETNRYASPPNPYFNTGANPAAFQNVRHPLRHGTPPVNVQGSPAMIQLSPQFAGYRRPGDPKSPNVLHGKQEFPAGHNIHAGNAATATIHGPNQGVKYGTIPANVGGNHRKSQSMSPLAALETLPLMTTNNSPNAATDQRSRPTNQMASYSPNTVTDQRNRPLNQISNSPNTLTDQRSRPTNQMAANSPNTLTDQRCRPTNQMAANSPNTLADQRCRPNNQMTANSPNTLADQRCRPTNQVTANSPNTFADQRCRPTNQMTANSPNTLADQRCRPTNQVTANSPNTFADQRCRPTNQMINNSPNSFTDQRGRPSNQMINNNPNAVTDQRGRLMNPMANNSPNTINEQRSRPHAQMVTSSDGTRGPPNANKRQDHCTTTGGNLLKGVQSATPPTGNTGQPRPSDVTFYKNSSVAPNGSHAPKNAQPSPTPSQEPGRTSTGECVGSKRPAPQHSSDSGLPSKRASPIVIIVDCDEGKPAASSPPTSANNQAAACRTPPTSRSESLPSEPIVVSDGQDPKNPAPQEARDGKRTHPISISSIRTSGIFNPSITKGRKDLKNDPNTIIIIDDKDSEAAAPQISQIKTSKDEARSSTSGTPPAKNPKAAGEPPPLAPKVQPQGVQQGTPVLVNKVQMQQQMQQPSPIIVTGGPSLNNQPLPVSGNQSIMLTFPVTVGSSGIVLATPLNITENQISGANPANKLPVSKNPRFVQPNSVPLNVTSQNVNAKLGQVTMRPVMGQNNRLAVPVSHGQAKPITVNVNQPGNVAGTLSLNNTNLQKVNGGTLQAVPVSASGNQPVGQPIPLFVDANSGLILTGPAVPSKDAVPPGIGNATVVTVNGGVVAGNVGPVAMGGKLAFSPVNVNGLGNTTFITVDRPVGLGNNSSVTLAGNPTNIANKGALNIGNPTILTLNGGLGIGGAHPVGAPIANIASINSSGALQVAPSSAPAVVGGQQNSGIIIRKVGDPSMVTQHPQPNEDTHVVVVESLFNCSECGEKFNSLEKLTSHQAAHKRPNAQPDCKGDEATSKDNEVLPGGADDDAPTILYTTQGDDGSTVYVVTV